MHLESKSIPARDAQICAYQDPETAQRLSQTGFECLSVSYGGMGQQQPDVGTGALAAADLGQAVCNIIPLEGVTISPTI